jgi:hypothetical protein
MRDVYLVSVRFSLVANIDVSHQECTNKVGDPPICADVEGWRIA